MGQVHRRNGFLGLGIALMLLTTTPISANPASVAVDHTPILYASPYEDLVVTATPSTPEKIQDMILFYRGAGKRLYESNVMSRSSSGVYSGVIPASAVSGKGVVYFIAAHDRNGSELFLFANPDRPHVVVSRSVVLLKSANLALYDDVIQGIRRETRSQIKEFDLSSIGPGGDVRLLRRLEAQPPEVIIALGLTAADVLKTSSLSKKVPIIYSMIADPRAVAPKASRSTGVSFDVSTKQALSSFQRIIPNVHRVGIVYDPGRTGNLVQEARSLAPSLGFELVTSRLEMSGELSAILRAFEKNIDAFWLIPDSTVMEGKNYGELVKFTRENRIPLFVFSPDLVRQGALVSLSADYESVGVQTGRLVQKILDGTDPSRLPTVYPERLRVSLNMQTAQDLKLEGLAQRIMEYAAENEYPLRVYK